MPIEATCPGCRAVLTVPDALAGKRCRCAHCQRDVPVPEAVGGPLTCRACGGELGAADTTCPYCGRTRLDAGADGPRDPERWELRTENTALPPTPAAPDPAPAVPAGARACPVCGGEVPAAE